MKKVLLLLAVLLTQTLANAQQVSEQEALLKAQQFIGNRNKTQLARGMSPRKAPKLTLANNRDEFYVFNDEANGGYVIVSGDERMPDVLGYSYNGFYDSDIMPSNMLAWMEEYAAQVQYLRAHPNAKMARKAVQERENIAPLLTCWFGQGYPYNDKCPIVNGVRCPTGCVATAMAQIMHYYQWPKQTTDNIPAYKTRTLGIEMPAMPITEIKWDKILDNYLFDVDKEQVEAISTLMLLCGASLKMDFHPDGSGAKDMGKALSNYFDYDELYENINRRDFETYDWESLIYNEIYNRRPVAYEINSIIAHELVIDGYENGFFHTNWGWGGVEAFLTMTDDHGWMGFLNEHSATIGIQPAKTGSPKRYAVYDNGKMTFYYDKKKDLRSGIVTVDWDSYKEEVTECVIDTSFVNLKRISLFGFFSDYKNMKSIEGLKNVNTSETVILSSIFSNCSSLATLDLSGFKTDKVTNMSNMFYGCSSLTSLDLSGFNTDKVTRVSWMFSGCKSLTSLDLSGFKTDKVDNRMSGMFEECSSLTSLDLSNFRTDNVTDMYSMFWGCSSLTSLNLSRFKTDNVTSMFGMFDGCSGLTSLDLSGFKTENVTNMGQMFAGCSNLETIYAGEGWNTDKVERSNCMFGGCTNLIGGQNTICDGSCSFVGLTYARIDGGVAAPGYLSSLDQVARHPYAVLTDDGKTVTFYCDTQKKNRGGVNINKSYISPDSSSPYTSITTAVFDASFANYRPFSTAFWFQKCSSLTTIIGMENLKTDDVTDMRYMFYGCSSLTSLDVSGFNTDNVTTMWRMFCDCKNLTSLDVSGFKTGNVTEMAEMFYGCSSLTSLDVSGFKTVNVTNMGEMFRGCSSLTSLDVSSFNTGNVTSMYGMFLGCFGLTSLDVSGFITNNVISMSWMFAYCNSLDSLDVSGFKTDNVKNMYHMFDGCRRIRIFPWQTSTDHA